MRIGDRQNSPDLPLQDHRIVPPHLRNVPRALRIEDRDAFGRYVVEGYGPPSETLKGSESPVKTVGDLQGGGYFEHEPAKGRGIGSWSFAMPCVVVEDERRGESIASGLPGTRGRERGASPHIGGQRANAKSPDTEPRYAPRAPTTNSSATDVRTVLVQPVIDGEFGVDKRYAVIEAALHPRAPRMVKGTPGVVLVASEEQAQVALFMPTQPNTLVCVNNGPDATRSTWVYDTKKGENDLDPDRAAALHTVWRVVPLRWAILGQAGFGSTDVPNPGFAPNTSARGPTGNPVLSWQLGTSGRDGVSGSGLCTDFAGPNSLPGLARAEEELRQAEREEQSERAETIAAIQRLEAQISGIRSIGGTNGRPGTAQRQQEQAALQHQVDVLRQQLMGSSLPREDEEDPGGGTIPRSGLVHACATARLSGPFEVGGERDAHQLTQDADGRPVNAMHLSTQALFQNEVGDCPLEFERLLYSRPGGMPLQAPVHLRQDDMSSHLWARGRARGLWRWEAEVPLVPPPEPPRIPPPPLPGPPPGGSGSAGAGAGGTSNARIWAGGDSAGYLPGGRGTGPGGSALRGRGPLTGSYGDVELHAGLPLGSLAAGGVSQIGSRVSADLSRRGVIASNGWPGSQILRVGDHGGRRRALLGGRSHRQPTALARLGLGGGAEIFARPTGSSEPDFAAGASGPAALLARYQSRMPSVGKIVGSAQGDGTLAGMQVTQQAEHGTPMAQGSMVLLPPDVDEASAETGTPSSPLGLTARLLAPEGVSEIGFAWPARGGGTRDGAVLRHGAIGLEVEARDSAGDDAGSLHLDPTNARIYYATDGAFIQQNGAGDIEVSGDLEVNGLLY